MTRNICLGLLASFVAVTAASAPAAAQQQQRPNIVFIRETTSAGPTSASTIRV
jgi:hypothetical protein